MAAFEGLGEGGLDHQALIFERLQLAPRRKRKLLGRRYVPHEVDAGGHVGDGRLRAAEVEVANVVGIVRPAAIEEGTKPRLVALDADLLLG